MDNYERDFNLLQSGDKDIEFFILPEIVKQNFEFIYLNCNNGKVCKSWAVVQQKPECMITYNLKTFHIFVLRGLVCFFVSQALDFC